MAHTGGLAAHAGWTTEQAVHLITNRGKEFFKEVAWYRVCGSVSVCEFGHRLEPERDTSNEVFETCEEVSNPR